MDRLSLRSADRRVGVPVFGRLPGVHPQHTRVRQVEVKVPADAGLKKVARRLGGERRRIRPGEALDKRADLRAGLIALAPDHLTVQTLLVVEVLEDKALVVA